MTIALSFGRWGGVYVWFRYTWRVCLGWVALTVIPRDDTFFRLALADKEELEYLRRRAA